MWGANDAAWGFDATRYPVSPMSGPERKVDLGDKMEVARAWDVRQPSLSSHAQCSINPSIITIDASMFLAHLHLQPRSVSFVCVLSFGNI